MSLKNNLYYIPFSSITNYHIESLAHELHCTVRMHEVYPSGPWPTCPWGLSSWWSGWCGQCSRPSHQSPGLLPSPLATVTPSSAWPTSLHVIHLLQGVEPCGLFSGCWGSSSNGQSVIKEPQASQRPQGSPDLPSPSLLTIILIYYYYSWSFVFTHRRQSISKDHRNTSALHFIPPKCCGISAPSHSCALVL